MNIAGGWYTTTSLGAMANHLRRRERAMAMISDQGVVLYPGDSRARAVLAEDGHGGWLNVGTVGTLDEAVDLPDDWYAYQRREYQRSRI